MKNAPLKQLEDELKKLLITQEENLLKCINDEAHNDKIREAYRKIRELKK